jgi:hypothetical protein
VRFRKRDPQADRECSKEVQGRRGSLFLGKNILSPTESSLCSWESDCSDGQQDNMADFIFRYALRQRVSNGRMQSALQARSRSDSNFCKTSCVGIQRPPPMTLFAEKLKGFPYLCVTLFESAGPMWKTGLHIVPPLIFSFVGQAYYVLRFTVSCENKATTFTTLR